MNKPKTIQDALRTGGYLFPEFNNAIDSGQRCAICYKPFVKERNIEGADVPVYYEHGYPVACEACYTPDCGYDKAETETL